MPGPSDLSFETPRVKARLLCEDDLDLYLALYTDPEVMRYIGPVMGREEVLALFSKVIDSNRKANMKGRYWGLRHRRTNQWLGQAALVHDAAVTSRAEVGIMLLDDAQNYGIALQVLRGLIRLASVGHDLPGMDDLIARHSPANRGAERLVEYVGFKRHGDSCGIVGWRFDLKEAR